METILIKISDIIERYESGEWQSAENLRIMLRELSSNYYFLTKHNIEAFNNHNQVQYQHKGSVAAGLILANERVPELRITRKILFATSKVIDAIRSELSIIKNEN